ncbi:MAG: BadF/BadG/BcrA/BcrD ATPase family protein [Ignavibacteriaceae bacterium]|jgi:N-acetylglucosamine kinase-like BadF-type ATPase
MHYIIGIDGGGTKTNCIVTDLEGKILYECSSGASNFLVQEMEKVSETIFGLIEKCKNHLNFSYPNIKIILLGTSGAGRKNDSKRLEKVFTEYSTHRGVTFNCFKVESDAVIALEGAFPGKPGCILIAGTGSILFCKDNQGRTHRVGGFGKLLGDEGGGYSIGKKGLKVISKELDGRSDISIILKLSAKKFGINSPEKLIEEVYINKMEISAVAPIVLKAAEQGDKESLKIIDEESEELVLHILAMIKKVGKPALNVALVGGLINHDNIYSRTLRKKMILEIPGVNIKEPEYTPAMGAILMAKKILSSKNL